MKKLTQLRPAIAAFLLMMAMAVTTTALSFFVTPVSGELDVGRGTFTVYYSLMTAAGAFSTTFLGQHINRKGVRGVLMVSSVWVAAGLFLFSVSGNVWMFYGVGAAIGVFGTSCVNLSANVIVQQSYSGTQATSLLGFVMAGSGVGGMILSMVLPGLIEQYGWRFGYRMLALIWAALVVSALLLMGKQNTSNSIGHRSTPVDGMTRAEAVRSPELYLLCAVIFIMAACCGIQQQLPSMLGGMGFETANVSAMVSFFTAALAVGKILQGILCGKVGVVRGSYIMVVVFAASFVVLQFRELVYPGLVLLAFGMGVVTTLMPMIARFAFGAREYAAIWSILATASSVGSFVASPTWGMVYDMTGSYAPAMMASCMGLIIALVLMTISFRKK